MTNVGILWVVLSPYCTGLTVAWSPPANGLVTRHLRAATWSGWLALATVFAGVFAVGGQTGLAIAAACAPVVGLAFWTAATGPDDGERPAPPRNDEPRAPGAIKAKGVRLKGPHRARPTGHGERRRTRRGSPTR
jgi:hypothetical protein